MVMLYFFSCVEIGMLCHTMAICLYAAHDSSEPMYPN